MPRFFLPRCMLLIVLILTPSQSTAADDAEWNRAIEQHRMGTLTVTAQPGATVRVEQVRHEFWFGAALSSGPFSPAPMWNKRPSTSRCSSRTSTRPSPKTR